MNKQSILKSALCLLMALVCNVTWAQTSTDGPIVTFTNVQQDGTTYTLHINNDNVLATSAESAEDLGDAAKFRATLQSDGTYTFYNESKGLYMIWRGKGEGHNSDKGVLEEYNADFCNWTLASGSNSKENTYFFYAKRNNTAKYGTLVLMKSNGAFDGWDGSAAWATNYSNLYTIESEEYVATLTDNQGTVITCTTKGLFPLPSYSGATLSNPVWANGKLAATVDAQFPALPFPLSSAEVTNPTFISSFKTGGGGSGPGRFKWYALDDTDDVVAKLDVAATHSTLKNFSWAIYATLENGGFTYSIKNVAKDKWIYSVASYAANNGSHADEVVVLGATPTKFQLTTDGENRLYYVGNSVNQYLSLNSTGTADAQQLGIYAKAHNGTTNSFHTPTYDLTSKDELVSGGIYTFVSSKGRMGATEEKTKVISTARTTVSDTNTDFFKWTMYQSKNGNYYLYNLGKQQFMGVQTANNTEIDFVDKPAGKTLTFKDNGQTNGYPIMFSTDNNGVVNHSTNHGGGLINWTGGWNKMDDAGSNHKVTYIGELTADQLKTIADLVEAYDKSLPIKVEVEGSWEGNPNTHFGNLTVTTGSAVATTKLTLKNMEISYVKYAGAGDILDFTREYRGFEFQGFFLGEENLGKSFTLTEAQEANIAEQNPLVAKFTATDEVTLFYDDDEFSYRIPAIATTSTGRLIAVSDYRHNLDDIGSDNHNTGTLRIDLVIRTSDDNGKTWSNIQTIAEGIDNSRDNNCAYGDAAIAVVGNEVIVMAVAGATQYNTGNESKTSRLVRVYSSDNGENWVKTDITEKVYGHEGSLYPNVYTSFFGSGRLAVDPNFNNSGTARIYGSMLTQGNGNIVIYSDDKGLTWNKLGGQVANANEPKIEILPSGQILFSARRNGGRNFNVFTYTNKANNEGTWSEAVNGCDNEGQNGTNGETFLVDAKNARGENVKLLLQSQPVGGGEWDRENVSIWYKEISSAADHNHTPNEIASGWTKGMQVSQQLSAYSAMSLQKDGKIAFFFEEAPCFGDDHTKGYCMVYIPLSIEEITECSYYSANVDPTASTTVNISLSDAQGNVYEFTKTSALNAIATTLTTAYPFITLGNNGNTEFDGTNFTYTNTVTLPFKVSNENTTIWHNIYFHTNGNSEYMYFYADAANASLIGKKNGGANTAYGNSQWNTAEHADNMSWAVYHAGNFTFTFKNKLTGKFIQVTSVADGNAENVRFVEEDATAFEIVKDVNNSWKGDYSLKASVGNKVGYLGNTSSNYAYATHYKNNSHQGGWVTFVEGHDFATLIDEVNGVLEMFGTSLGQYAATDAVTVAKEAMENSGNVKLNDLNTYKGLLTGATLNTPQPGQFFRVAYDYGGSVGKLYMQGENSTAKGVKFTADKGTASIWQYRDGGLYSYTAEKYLREVDNDRGLSDTKTTATFSASTRAAGKYNITCTSYIHANSNGNGQYYSDHCSSNNCAAHDLILEEIEPTTVTINAFVGFGTLYAPVALAIPDGLEAYVASEIGNNSVTLESIEGVIPANTGVLLKVKNNSSDVEVAAHHFNLNISEEPAGEKATSLFLGTVAKTLITLEVGTTCYVLAAKNGNVGLYIASLNYDCYGNKVAQDGTSFYNNAGKAYLPVKTPAQAAPALVMRFGRGQGTTEIELPTANGQQPTAVYDLQGRRVLNPTKGIYIVNGKKVLF